MSMNRYYNDQTRLSKLAMNKIKGRKLKNITYGYGQDIILEFMDSTKACIKFTTYPDGTIRELLIEVN